MFRGKFSRDNDVTGDGDARSRSVCDLTLSVASAHKFTREETNDDTLNCSENLSDEEQGQDPASLLEHSKPSSNIHIPNVRACLSDFTLFIKSSFNSSFRILVRCCMFKQDINVAFFRMIIITPAEIKFQVMVPT